MAHSVEAGAAEHCGQPGPVRPDQQVLVTALELLPELTVHSVQKRQVQDQAERAADGPGGSVGGPGTGPG